MRKERFPGVSYFLTPMRECQMDARLLIAVNPLGFRFLAHVARKVFSTQAVMVLVRITRLSLLGTTYDIEVVCVELSAPKFGIYSKDGTTRAPPVTAMVFAHIHPLVHDNSSKKTGQGVTTPSEQRAQAKFTYYSPESKVFEGKRNRPINKPETATE